MHRILFILSLAFFFRCSERSSEIKNLDTIENDGGRTNTQIAPQTVLIQPYSDVPEKFTQFVFTELKKICSNVEVLAVTPLPGRSYYAPRSRYRADSLINILRQGTPDGKVSIGLTTKDISSTKGDIKDYGIMGLGYQPGRACVISTFRLNKKQDLTSQLFKLAIHELGHTQGLPHCSVNTCYMRDAEGKNHLGEENGFCESCRKHLESKGWKLNQ